MWFTAIDTYPGTVRKMHFPLLLWGVLLTSNAFGNHATFGFCHDSWYLVNSTKITRGKVYFMANEPNPKVGSLFELTNTSFY